MIPGFFDIVRSQNRGVAFGMFNDSTFEWRTALLVLVSAGGRGGGERHHLERAARSTALPLWGLALVLGGAAGNLFDRILSGRVTDFLDFYIGDYHWPTFNVADSAMVIGSGLLLLDHAPSPSGRRPMYPEIFHIPFLHTYGVLVAWPSWSGFGWLRGSPSAPV